MPFPFHRLHIDHQKRLRELMKPVELYKLQMALGDQPNYMQPFQPYQPPKRAKMSAPSETADTSNEQSPTSLVMDSIDTPESELAQMSRCCVCYETYNDATRAPITIPCGHTFCKACVDTVRVDRLICCCNCRTVSIASTEEFQKNLALIQILTHLNLLANDSRPPRDPPIKDFDTEYDKILDNLDVDEVEKNLRFQHFLIHNYICHYLPNAANNNEVTHMKRAVDSVQNCYMPVGLALMAIRRILNPELYEWVRGTASFPDSSDDEDNRGVAPPLSPSSNSSGHSAPMLTQEDEEHFREMLLETGEARPEVDESVALISGNVAHLEPADEVESEEVAEPEVADVEAVVVENNEVAEEYEASWTIQTESWKTRFIEHMETNWHFYLFVFIILYAHLSCYLYSWYFNL